MVEKDKYLDISAIEKPDYAKEAMHYRALARYQTLRARFALIVTAALFIALAFALFGEDSNVWWEELALLAGALVLFGIAVSVIGELAWVKAGGSEMRYFSKDLARRDSGVNYYFARPDGGLARWHRRRVIEESSYDSHEEAERVAWEKNVALAQKGKYVGRNGESWPDEADEPHDY